MNIESSKIKQTSGAQINTSNLYSSNNSTRFADELEDVKKTQEEVVKEEVSSENEEKVLQSSAKEEENELGGAIKELNSALKDINRTDDKLGSSIKNKDGLSDNNHMINNDFNIQDNKDIMPQMNPNMNFSGNGQPFSSFMNNSADDKKAILNSSAQELLEEAAILSTMAENMAIANRNQSLARTVSNEEGIKKVESKTGIKIESVIKYDAIIMNQADVEVFAALVQNGEVDLNSLLPKVSEKSVQISKTLADMLVKSMENNQPLRINFDNDISVIIRISRDGKITADFLPSSQIAEAYLRENLPLLRQRFDQNNIEYDSLNQRERKDSNKENHKKKDRNNE